VPDSASKLQKSFGVVVRSERISRDLSQEKLAFEAGLSLTYIGEIERGEKMPSLDTIARIAKAVGLSGSELLAKAKI
jgi:transcriptional regulator with XRE-family HTH domain